MTLSGGCSIPFDILEQYPHQVYGLFISNPYHTANYKATDIPNSIPAMIELIERCGQDNTIMGTEELVPDPYPVRLLELDGLEQVYSSKRQVLLESMEIYTYDPKKIGSAHQDTNVNAEVTSSIGTQNQILPQSTYLYGMFGQAQPNFLRPSLYIDDRPYLTGMRSAHKGIGSIGLPTPLCRQFFKKIAPPDKIHFNCGAGTWIPGEAKIRRLFVLGVLNFRLESV